MVVLVQVQPATGAASVLSLSLTGGNWMGQLAEQVDPKFQVRAVSDRRADILGQSLFGSWYVEAHVFRVEKPVESQVWRWTAELPELQLLETEDIKATEEKEAGAESGSGSQPPSLSFAPSPASQVLKDNENENADPSCSNSYSNSWVAECGNLTKRVAGTFYGYSDVFEAFLVRLARVPAVPVPVPPAAAAASAEKPSLLEEVTQRLSEPNFGLKATRQV
jgi:hypothetical protein